ncbi:MAG: hypothetical protein ACTSUY_08925, partial [Alphaproteobacteria bacterium]
VVEIEPGDREPDRRYWGIQQCCRRLIEGRPLRGTYCTRKILRQSLQECNQGVSDNILAMLLGGGRPAQLRQSRPQTGQTQLRIPFVSLILDIFGI